MNQPQPALLTVWGWDRNLEKTVAVYDLGGGTFDISILRYPPAFLKSVDER